MYYYYKLEKVLLQIGTAFKIKATIITNRETIIDWGKMYYKLVQVLQIRAIITNWGITQHC